MNLTELENLEVTETTVMEELAGGVRNFVIVWGGGMKVDHN